MSTKSAIDVILDRFLRDVEEKGSMPWQRPYERYNAFNYFSLNAYRGFNRLMLPFGEYMTKNQIFQYNKSKGYISVGSDGKMSFTPEAYRFQKGILWYPIVFFKKDTYKISVEIAKEEFGVDVNPLENRVWCRLHGWLIYTSDGSVYKEKSVLRYYEVAERRHFKNANGDCLPSRLESGEVVITKSNPKTVLDSYIKREGIKLDTAYAGTPCYVPAYDEIHLNPYTKSEGAWFSTAFHEAGHSTGAASRLNRAGVALVDALDSDKYAKEECIAEICACLCCAETGISDFQTSGIAEYENSIAYVQNWKKQIKDWGKDFIYVVSQADKAFNYICGDPDSAIPESDSDN